MSETPAIKKRRVQIQDESDDSVEVLEPEPTTRKLTPTAAARFVVVKAVASHPEPFRELLLAKSQSFNALRSKLRQQEQVNQKLEEESFVPRSARFSFILKATGSVMETEAYKTLADKMDAAVATWKTTAKAAIFAVAKLEVEKLKDQIATSFTETAKQLAKLLLLKANPDTDLSEVILATLALETHGSAITKHSGMTVLEAQQALHHPTPFNGIDISDNTKTLHNPFVPAFHTLMAAAFVDSWDAQLDYYKQQASERAMTKQVKDFLGGAATQQAAAAMDMEPTADPALLKDIVKKQVDCGQKKMQAEINKLKQALARSIKPTPTNNQKNNNRGAAVKTQTSAPSPKKPPANKPSILKKSKYSATTVQQNQNNDAATAAKQGKGTQSGKAAFRLTRKASPERGRPIKQKGTRKKQQKK